MQRIIISASFGGGCLPRSLIEAYRAEGGESRDPARDDPLLIRAFERIAPLEKCKEWENPIFALDGYTIIQIPDGVEWEIESYDGMEWVAEKHRRWGIDSENFPTFNGERITQAS